MPKETTTTETTTETTAEKTAPAIDESKIAEMVKNSASAAVREALAGFQPQTTPTAPAAEPDYFESIVDNRTAGRLSALNLKAESAEDKADFYSSDFWQEDIDDYLTGETPEDIKAEKKELRKKLETYFDNLVKQGKALQRSEVALRVLGEMVHENKSKYDEKVIKRHKKTQETELEKAKTAVNIGRSAVANFDPQTVHAMEQSKIDELYGDLVF